METKVTKNKYGFYELEKKELSEEYLKLYYQEKYYQENKGAYQNSYTEEEKVHIINTIKQKHHIINSIQDSLKGKLLDIGCGEGWVLQYFQDYGWDVTGLDYSSFGVEGNCPSMLNKVVVGNIYDNLTKLDTKYDVIWLDNVLEHVLDPFSLLVQITNIMSEGCILMIEVPNDFSLIQQKLLEMKYIDNTFWVTPPDHISYFNREGLNNICDAAGLTKISDSASFPIDFNLLNNDTNYVRDKSKGKNVHLSRVMLENILSDISIPDTVELYQSLAKLGLGRNIISFFSLSQ